MPNNYQSQSLRISEFNSQSLIQDTDLFTFVRNSTNYNVRWSDLKLDLGVTGSIEPIGAPTATPVLYTVGDSYYIRGVETSKGVVSTLSPQNGLSLGLNFSQVGAGGELIKDLNASQYQFRTLVGGENINVTQEDDELRIDFVSNAGTTKTVVVSEESDFPDPVGGVITLANNTDYVVVNDITTTNRFAVGTSTVLRAASSQLIQLTYTGSGDMFSGANPSFKIRDITVSCPSGNLFNVTSASPSSIIQLIEMNVQECQTLGTISGAFIVRLTNVAFEDIVAGGFTFADANLYFSMNTILAFIQTGTLFDFGTSTFRSMSISNGVIEATGSGVAFISGLASSGNIDVGGLATVTNNKTFGVDTQLSGITSKDDRWQFTGNNNIADTIDDGLVYTVGNALETVIAATGTPVKTNAVFTTEDVSRFTHDGTGRLTYVGTSGARLPIDVTASAIGASGGDKQATMYIAINGSVVAATAIQETINSAKAGSFAAVWQYEFATNDYVEIWFENNQDTTNIVVQSAVLRIN